MKENPRRETIVEWTAQNGYLSSSSPKCPSRSASLDALLTVMISWGVIMQNKKWQGAYRKVYKNFSKYNGPSSKILKGTPPLSLRVDDSNSSEQMSSPPVLCPILKFYFNEN